MSTKIIVASIVVVYLMNFGMEVAGKQKLRKQVNALQERVEELEGCDGEFNKVYLAPRVGLETRNSPTKFEYLTQQKERETYEKLICIMMKRNATYSIEPINEWEYCGRNSF